MSIPEKSIMGVPPLPLGGYHFLFSFLLLEQIIVNFLSDIKAQLYLTSLSNEINQNASYHILTKKLKGSIDLKLLTQIIIM